MANQSIFKSMASRGRSEQLARNQAGGLAYEMEPRQALAQLAATGCISSTFYSTDHQQLDKVLSLCQQVSPYWIAKVAIYSRQRGFMKDMPALLLAVLLNRDANLFERVFPLVVDNGKMLRNFVQIVRSGRTGRKCLGSCAKRLVQRFLVGSRPGTLLNASVGNDPSLADVLRLAHPRPYSSEQSALFSWILGKELTDAQQLSLPREVRELLDFRSGLSLTVPNVDFRLLTSQQLTSQQWAEVAKNASWTMLRMNLNTFERQGVFKDADLRRLLASKLEDAEAIRKARAFPYQLLGAALAAEALPYEELRAAVRNALEISTENVPVVEGNVVVAVDVSASMCSPVTGHRKGSTSAVTCQDVAALVGSAILRRNPQASVIPFGSSVISRIKIRAEDSILENTRKHASINGGGTNCSSVLQELNHQRKMVDLVVYVSDNESWVDSSRPWLQSRGATTAMLEQWGQLKVRCPQAKLVCIDITPNTTTQVSSGREDVLNIGGFSDAVFTIVSEFSRGEYGQDFWLQKIEEVQIPEA